jgi:hypothetical protein
MSRKYAADDEPNAVGVLILVGSAETAASDATQCCRPPRFPAKWREMCAGSCQHISEGERAMGKAVVGLAVAALALSGALSAARAEVLTLTSPAIQDNGTLAIKNA